MRLIIIALFALFSTQAYAQDVGDACEGEQNETIRCEGDSILFCSAGTVEDFPCSTFSTGAQCIAVGEGFGCAVATGEECVVDDQGLGCASPNDRCIATLDHTYQCTPNAGTCNTAVERQCVGDLRLAGCPDENYFFALDCASLGATCEPEACVGIPEGGFCAEGFTCAEGLNCEDSVCTDVPGQTGDECLADSECSFGLDCLFGVCTQDVFFGDFCGNPGLRCADGTECIDEFCREPGEGEGEGEQPGEGEGEGEQPGEGEGEGEQPGEGEGEQPGEGEGEQPGEGEGEGEDPDRNDPEQEAPPDCSNTSSSSSFFVIFGLLLIARRRFQ